MANTVRSAILTLLVIGMTATPVLAQKLYKWVDKDGNVHYSDQVPPDQVDQAREQLNEQGIVVDRVDRAPTKEELAEMRANLAQMEAERKAMEKQRADDQRMLASWPSEDDILRSQDQQIDAIRRSVEAAQAYIDGQTRSLAGLMERAAQMESQGRSVSDALQSSIEDVKDQIAEQEEFIAGRQAEQATIENEYQDLLTRYRELRARKNSSG
jgi:chromosome segregation ATPase